MNKFKFLYIFTLLICSQLMTSCDFFWGKKNDDQTNQIFKDGRIDPNLIPSKAGYVPILPIWSNFQNPNDVLVGYDEMVYVADDRGVTILDQTGAVKRTISIRGATDLTMDRRLHLYVAGRVDYTVGGKTYDLPAIFHITNSSLGSGPNIIDTMIHPFCDNSRKTIALRSLDEKVNFTGLACRADNVLYASRTGVVNDPTSTAYPDNTVLLFDINGKNTTNTNGLSGTFPNLKSLVGVSSIATFTGPPQRVTGVNESHDFIVCQAGTGKIEYRALWIKEINDPDNGISYSENIDLLNKDTTKSSRFLMDSYKFSSAISDVYVAPDQSGYIFILDKDSLFQFTSKGNEGANPPAGSKIKKQILASFGGQGSGPFNFNSPSGVCYFNKTVYVADKGNNRIIRYRLSTDVE